MKSPIGLFEAFGIEIELMIVDKKTLDVRPTADQLLTDAHGSLVSDYEDGPITWSNELVSHVIEFKTTAPAPMLDDLEQKFFKSQRRASELLSKRGARLMPTGMHPWMNPLRETVIWPHDNNEIYSLYNTIFDCRGHGWSNLQSVHINLPFKSEDEFARLHSAIRAILPLIPALSASTPLSDGHFKTFEDLEQSLPSPTNLSQSGSTHIKNPEPHDSVSLRASSSKSSFTPIPASEGSSKKPAFIKDTRLAFYETNQRRLPIIAGNVIPVHVVGFDDYRAKITNPIQVAIKPFDSEGLLEGDWLNSRGAIARIDRGTIEIRLVDTQECAHADLSIVQLIVGVVRSIVDNEELLNRIAEVKTESLYQIYRSCVEQAEDALINDPSFLALFGLSGSPRSARDLWIHLSKTSLHSSVNSATRAAIDELLSRPTLATRIQKAVGQSPTRETISKVYRQLCDCLDNNKIFITER